MALAIINYWFPKDYHHCECIGHFFNYKARFEWLGAKTTCANVCNSNSKQAHVRKQQLHPPPKTHSDSKIVKLK